jgi:LuxR family transcriptional regulator, maltose regulon positive regulatory protein
MIAHHNAPSDIFKAKIHPPGLRRDEVPRSRTIRSLAEARDTRVISIVAPPGYGKTTLLAQWARSQQRPVAWLTIDPADNDVVSLFSYLSAAVERVAPLDQGVVAKLESPGLPPYAIARLLLSALPESGADVLVVIDDAHHLTDYSVLDALGELVEKLPQGWQIAIAGRTQPSLQVGRWRSESFLLEIGADELVLDEHECEAMARRLGLELSTEQIRQLVQRLEGWPAGLYLAILAMKRSGPKRPSALPANDEPYLADYLRSEVLPGLDPDMMTFLSRTAFLTRVSPSLGDAVMGTDGSAAKLEALATRTSLVVRLGGGRGWYRYHTLLREHLWAEFEQTNAALISELHLRAGVWYEAHGLAEDAVVELLAAGDDDRAANQLGSVAWNLFYSGRAATVTNLGDRFDDSRLERHPWLATWLAWAALYAGDVVRVARMVNVTDRATFVGPPPDGTASFESGRAMLNVFLARDGTDGMRSQADLALAAEPTWSPWRPLALQSSGIASMARGDHDRAERDFAETVEVARAASASEEEQGALALLAFLAIEEGDWRRAESLTERSAAIMRASHLELDIASVVTHAARARVSLHRGDVPDANASLANAQLLRPRVTYAAPWLSVRCLLELGRAYLAMSDMNGARATLSQAEGIVRKRPNIGPVATEVRALREQMPLLPTTFTGSSGLTASELRVLALLPFHLSYREIGDRLGVKESTVKTHTHSIYAKLGVSTRGGAIEMASAVGLIAGIPS